MSEKPPFLALCLFLICLLLAVQTMVAWAAAPEPRPFNFEKSQAAIKEISRRIKGGQITRQQMEDARKQTENIAKTANTCVDTTTAQIARLEQEATSLGPATDSDSPEIVKERKSLQKKTQALVVSQSECRLALTLTNRLINDLADQEKLIQTASFFTRSLSFGGRYAATLPSTDVFTEQLGEYLVERAGIASLTPEMFLILFLLVIVGSVTGFHLFRLLRKWSGAVHSNLGIDPPEVKGRLALPTATATLLAGGYLAHVSQDSLAVSTAYGPWLAFSISLYCLSTVLFHLQTEKSGTRGSAASPRRFALLALLAVLQFFSTRLNFDGFPALATVIGFGQSLVICSICVVGWWFLWPIHLPEKWASFEKLRKTMITVLAVLVMTVEFSGYRNFSHFVLGGLFGTFVLGILLRFCLFFIDHSLGGFFTGKYRWQQVLRKKLGLSTKDNLTGMAWIKVIFKLVAWAIGLLFFLQLWGMPDAQEKMIHGYLVDGFNIGGLIIAPARMVFGVFLFACGWTLVSWLKMQLEKRWLKKAGFSASDQETLVTLTGYVGFSIALLLGLSIAGFSFSNLAVIAGALSVGIGFGMQNIVNNFVSGLIILFEKPVKRGDWIKIGNTEGFVQKISVRSTLIQTFDRSDVIVPNSELISNQVTNMMLNDNFGRLIVPIGVAYGSDIDLVRSLLLEIAAKNESVVNDGSTPRPVVLFLSFGDNSLNFELRCHLDHIDKRMTVMSEINYEIDRAFRSHNISIPFPQRDLYIKEFPRPHGEKTPQTASAGDLP